MTYKGIKSGLSFAALVAAILLIPAVSFAQSTPVAGGIGNVILNADSTKNSFALLLSATSYALGVGLGFWGLIRLKSWSDGQGGFADGLWRVMGGALLIALPDFVQKMLNSVFGSWTSGSSTVGGIDRTSGLQSVAAPGSGWLGLDQAMENFIIDIYAPAKALTAITASIIGVACMATGVYRLAQSGAGQGKAPSAKGTAGYILGGSLMLAAGNVMDAVSTTLFGTASTPTFTSLAYTLPSADSTAVNNVIKALFAFVEIIGWIAFVRGIFLLVKLAQGGHEKTHAHAFSHIVFGAAAVNMFYVASAIQTTLGIQLVK